MVQIKGNDDSALKKSMTASLKAYASGSATFFDFIAPDIRVYGLDSAEPFTSKKAFQAAFEENLKKFKRQVKVVNQDLQVVDGQAILSQTLQITSSGVTSYVRQTVIWQSASGNWLMTHIHNAFVGEPISTGKMPTTARGIRVLNDRIATAAAVVGVAQ